MNRSRLGLLEQITWIELVHEVGLRERIARIERIRECGLRGSGLLEPNTRISSFKFKLPVD